MREAGFTLVELMVVLVIIGLLSTAAMLAMPKPGAGLADEAERFAARARAAHELAIIENRLLSLRVDTGGYRIEARGSDGWTPLMQRPFQPVAWVDGTRASVGPTGERSLLDPTGLADPLLVTLSRGGALVRVELSAGGDIRVRR